MENSTFGQAQMTIIQISREELSRTIKQAVQDALADQNVRKIDDTLLSRKDAAKYFGVTLPTLGAWERSGRIKAIRLGSRVYFRKNELLLNAA